MARFKQGKKRVSWAADGNLCKVRLFLSEDAPSLSGVGAQDHLQAKAAWLLHATGSLGPDDSLPPGFEAPHRFQPKIDISQISQIKWWCPPRLMLNPDWLVVAGEESQEVVLENQRQPGVLEAVYPRPSSIPPNPSVYPDVQDSGVDDSHTPLIPITAIEDEDGVEELDDSVAEPDTISVQLQNLQNVGIHHHPTSSGSRSIIELLQSQSQSQSIASPSLHNLPRLEQSAAAVAGIAAAGAEPDVMAAASAAFTAIMRSCEEGSLVDRDLLIKILSNPGMIEKLLSEYGAPKQAPQQQLLPSMAPTSLPPPPPLSQFPLRPPLPGPPISHISAMPNMVAQPPALNTHPSVQMPPMPPPVRPPPPPMKDMNYLKSLIQQHGGDKQDGFDLGPLQYSNSGSSRHDYHNNNNMMGVANCGEGIGIGPGGLKQRDFKPKIQKPCVYFSTPRGCRNGASCSYLHDGSIPQQIEQQKGTAKRIKLDNGIAGRN